jgi:aldehyde dehydrogenase (NAD+)
MSAASGSTRLGARRWRSSNPATEERIGTVSLGSAADVERAVQSATEAFETFGRWSKADRLALLRRIRELTAERREDLAQAISLRDGRADHHGARHAG